MIPNEYIEYNGKQYPLFLVNIINQSDEESTQNMEMIEVPISVTSLSNVLIDLSDSPVNAEATAIDERVFFYIPDELADKEANEIADFVSDNCW